MLCNLLGKNMFPSNLVVFATRRQGSNNLASSVSPLYRTPEQCPSVVSLLSESYNPHVRYGAAMALGISCAGTGSKVTVVWWLGSYACSKFHYKQNAVPVLLCFEYSADGYSCITLGTRCSQTIVVMCVYSYNDHLHNERGLLFDRKWKSGMFNQNRAHAKVFGSMTIETTFTWKFVANSDILRN